MSPHNAELISIWPNALQRGDKLRASFKKVHLKSLSGTINSNWAASPAALA